MAAPAGRGIDAGAQGMTRPPQPNLLSQAQKLASVRSVVSAAPHIGGKVARGGLGVVWPPEWGEERAWISSSPLASRPDAGSSFLSP